MLALEDEVSQVNRPRKRKPKNKPTRSKKNKLPTHCQAGGGQFISVCTCRCSGTGLGGLKGSRGLCC